MSEDAFLAFIFLPPPIPTSYNIELEDARGAAASTDRISKNENTQFFLKIGTKVPNAFFCKTYEDQKNKEKKMDHFDSL